MAAKKKKKVMIGILGSVLDAGRGPGRWEKWRPTIALCSQEDILLDRVELLHEEKTAGLAEQAAKDIIQVSPETKVRPHVIAWGDPWDFEEVYAHLHEFAAGLSTNTEKEEYFVHITTGTHVAQICLFLLTEARYLPGKLIQSSPPPRSRRGTAGDYRVIDLDLSRYDGIASRFKQEKRDAVAHLKSGIRTRNRAFNELIDRIEKVAIESRSPILLMGPTGAGKSRLARRIHELKHQRRRVTGPFVEVNCATLRGEGAMSALFGHIKGAFTGAVQSRKGLLRSAHQGILFLDEIGELGLDEQAMLLRALEEKKFTPLGGDSEVESDFQLIAGTNRDLHAGVRAGRFREDLLARINLWTFVLPGLRERPEDIEPNLQYELERFAAENGRMVRFSREALRRFLDFAESPRAVWDANFRDLNAAMTRMAVLSSGGRITGDVVRDEIDRLLLSWGGPGAGANPGGREPKLAARVLGAERLSRMDLFESLQLEQVLRVCRESASLSEAGRNLFAVSREKMKTRNDADRLRKYLARYDIKWEDLRLSDLSS